MTIETDIIHSILAINPTAQVSVSGDDVNQITWENGTAPISKEDILAKQVELKADYAAKEYQRDREKEYPSWQDQMDMQYHDKVNGTSTWQTAIAKVKSDNPKE
jgi:phosphosulfolactate synthase (CoM biosynthesis protein A)|tara:strand:+ start:611 stop:922 length:312 start_codon:yes stop_codon:yes gene_type:complete